jgi:protein phosphatase 2C
MSIYNQFTILMMRGNAIRGGGGEAGTSDDAVTLIPEPVAPKTMGSAVVIAIICSSHIIVSNYGDSWAVICRGKQTCVSISVS